MNDHSVARSFWVPLTGRKVLLILVALFGVVFAVNGTFIYYALHSWSGLTDDGSYVSGLHFNKSLEQVRAQDSLGWSSEVAYSGSGFTVKLSDASSAPLVAKAVTLNVMRPVHEGQDIALNLREVSPGIYFSAGDLPLRGRWTAEVVVSEGDQVRYRLNHSIMVMP